MKEPNLIEILELGLRAEHELKETCKKLEVARRQRDQAGQRLTQESTRAAQAEAHARRLQASAAGKLEQAQVEIEKLRAQVEELELKLRLRPVVRKALAP